MIYSQYEQMKNLLFRSNISLFPSKDNTFRRTMECEPQGVDHLGRLETEKVYMQYTLERFVSVETAFYS